MGENQGKLKIFFGYAAGVGKTYAMLEAAHRVQKDGVDVVAGYVEPHARPDTIALLDGIEQLPPAQYTYKGMTLKEFDLDAALQRKPGLILVDELAHTNAQGCRHRKRYQDVEELLRAGIDVCTTVNVQHLESLNDVVSAITGITVLERVPDKLFDQADQVELVDVEPEELLERLSKGKVYEEFQSKQAMAHFFTKENLISLREIAMRRSADRLNRSARKSQNKGAAKTNEHVLICLSPSPSNAKVIRTAARFAEDMHGRFTALFVETPSSKSMSAENQRRLQGNLRLAEQLGAKIATVYGDDAAVQIAEYAKAGGVTKVVIGHSHQKYGRLLGRKSLVDRLMQLAENLDIYIIPDQMPGYREDKRLHIETLRFSLRDLIKSLAVIAAASGIGALFYLAGFSEANIITVYILGVLVTAVWTNGRMYSALASLLSVIVFNFLFTVPRFTLRAYDASYPVTFLIMLVAGILTSSLAMQIKEQARQAARKAYRTEVLLETSQLLQKAGNADEILHFTAEQLHKLLERPIFFYHMDAQGEICSPQVYPESDSLAAYEEYLTKEGRATAQWVCKNNKQAGATTDTFPGEKCLYLAVRGRGGSMAVAVIPVAGYSKPDAFEKNLLLAILDECGLVLEKEKINREKQQAEMAMRQEALRSNLLRAISHDLRTPLTSITGNARVLMDNEEVLDKERRNGLYVSIYDDSMWLINLVENLLSVTRIENGTMRIKMEPELLEEVFHEALQHLDRRAVEHVITAELEDDMLMARIDVQLIMQVLINIVNNAIKYTPPGSHIRVFARRDEGMVWIHIADDGPGISEEAKAHLFDMFYTANNGKGDSRRGLGLGLSLCKSIINAHGGTIYVKDNEPKGSEFCFSLQAVEVNAGE
ncbi:MAG: DUF4118 domain-containing protein [Blautia sp.]|jgi:two-component system sensor histidine kinase KdpD